LAAAWPPWAPICSPSAAAATGWCRWSFWTGYLINSLTLATLACFIFNICWVVVTAALTGADVGAIKINGNEALIFWIFVYSFGQAALSLRRAVLAVAPKA
jgi:hypothetical protein